MLWRLRNEGGWLQCTTRVVPIGVEIEILKDGTPFYSRIFAEGDEALAWAEAERLMLTEPDVSAT